MGTVNVVVLDIAASYSLLQCKFNSPDGSACVYVPTAQLQARALTASYGCCDTLPPASASATAGVGEEAARGAAAAAAAAAAATGVGEETAPSTVLLLQHLSSTAWAGD